MDLLFRCKKFLVGALLAGLVSASGAQAGIQNPFSLQAIQKTLGQTSIPFIKNQGEQHADVAFYAPVPGGRVFVDKQGDLVYSLLRGTERIAFKEHFVLDKKSGPYVIEQGSVSLNRQDEKGVHRLKTAKVIGVGQSTQGIRVELRAHNNNVEKFFYVSPGASPSRIKVGLEGIKETHIASDGKLVFDTAFGPVFFSKPLAYQNSGKERQAVDVAYVLKDNHYGFQVGQYDTSRELVIDPVIYATYLGGSDGYPTYTYDNVFALVADGDYIYAAGSTQSPDFPTALGYDSSFDDIRDGFVVRMSADLSTLVNATFIGGAVYDMLRDSNGELIVAGQAYAGFPRAGGAYNYPSDYEQTGGFIARLNADLTQLLASGVVVPASSIQKIALGNGDLYFTGVHNQNNLAITPNAFQTECFCINQTSYGANTFVGYMGRISADLTALHALSWIGGSTPSDIAVADDSSVYITNSALSIADGAIRQFDADITTLLASQSFAYLGNASTAFNAMALGDNFVIVGGSTKKNNLPTTPGAYDSTCGTNGDCDNTDTTFYIAKSDGFLVRYSRDLQSIEALTYIGGSGHDSVGDLFLDGSGNVVFNGYAGDPDFPLTPEAEQNSGGSYFARMPIDFTSLQYATLADVGGEMTYAGNNNIYLGGSISSSGVLPVTSGAFDTTYNGGATDGYIMLYQIAAVSGTTAPGNNDAPVADAGLDRNVVEKTSVILDGSHSYDSDGSIVAYHWTQLKGKSVSIRNADSAVATFTAPKTRKNKSIDLIFGLTVTDDKGATDSDQVTITVTP